MDLVAQEHDFMHKHKLGSMCSVQARTKALLSKVFQAHVIGIFNLPHLPFLSFPEVLFTWWWNVLYLLIFI